MVVAPGAEEEARARMIELAPGGFEERSDARGLELAVYTDAAGEGAMRGAFGEVTSAAVPEDWEQRWKTFHQPVQLGSLWIGPPWRRPAAGLLPVVVDPGRAFGTGAHDTTRLCLEELQRLPRGALLDVGCGSGVLSVAASLLGFAPVVAVDTDPNAIEATRLNADGNRVDVDVRLADGRAAALPAAEVTVANVSLTVVEAVLPRVRSPWAVVSGFRVEDEPAADGWERVRRVGRSGWAVEVLHKRTE